MHWEVEKEADEVTVPDDVVDVVFDIRCKSLPVDNAWAIYQGLKPHLPWIDSEARAAIHPLRVAESAHGWQRPEDPDELLHLSRRTRLILRLPAARVDEALALAGKVLEVAGHSMEIAKGSVRKLSKDTTLTAHNLVIEEDDDEEQFVRRQIDRMRALGVKPKKVLPGLSHTLRTADDTLCVVRLTVEGLSIDDAIKLQQEGLGQYGYLGCGIFIPQKPMT